MSLFIIGFLVGFVVVMGLILFLLGIFGAVREDNKRSKLHLKILELREKLRTKEEDDPGLPEIQ